MNHRNRALGVLLLVTLAACAEGAAVGSAEATPPPSTTATTEPEDRELVEDDDVELPASLRNVVASWRTDFRTRTIDLEELAVGIPAIDPRDLIPPIDDPAFETSDEADEWLEDPEPGVLLERGHATRFYPLSILTRHEIVNDEIDGRPVAVTYCPLCNTGIVFDPVVDGTALRFGVSGLLRQSDLVMWDDVTESLWQQITGEAIVGALAGTTLETLPSRIVRWADARDGSDGLEVLGRDQGFGVPYGANPYVGYSSQPRPIPGFFQGEVDDRHPAMERVVGVSIDQGDKAYPFSVLAEERVVNDTIGDVPVAVLWGAPATADALDSGVIANGRGIGTGVAYQAEVDGTALTFEPADGDTFLDTQTGTTWDLLGNGLDGPLAGSTLTVLAHRNEFWFAWQAFFPDAPVYEG